MPVKKPLQPRKPGRMPVRRRVKHEAVPTPEPVLDVVDKQEEPKFEPKSIPLNKTFYAVGKRKTAVAQILLSGGNGAITINNVPFETYFSTAELQSIAKHPLMAIGLIQAVNIRAKIHGGGIHAQSEALRHAVARAIISLDPESRRTLKKLGFLTRDSRVKERKKPGLKRARRAPQFSKR